MVNVIDPFGDPIGFMILYFLFNATYDFLMFFKLGLMSSVLVFPFLWLGRFLHKKLSKKFSCKVRLFICSAATVLIFLIAIRIWQAIFNPEYSFSLPPTILYTWLIASIIVFLFALLGRAILAKIRKYWTMPEPIYWYLIDLIMCVLFWIILTAIYLILLYSAPV